MVQFNFDFCLLILLVSEKKFPKPRLNYHEAWAGVSGVPALNPWGCWVSRGMLVQLCTSGIPETPKASVQAFSPAELCAPLTPLDHISGSGES